MKVLFLAANVSVGSGGFGTEAIVRGLLCRLKASGLDIHLAGHARAGVDIGEDTVNGIPTHVLPPIPKPTRDAHFAIASCAPGYSELLRKIRPQIVQIFSLTASAINLSHLEIAKKHGCKTVLWHNVPGITCLQRGLLYESKTSQPCDGEVRITRCTQCRLRQVGVAPALSSVFSRIGAGAAGAVLPHRMESLLGARRLTSLHKSAVASMLDNLDAIQVGAVWAQDVFLRNGAKQEKLHLIRPGVDLQSDNGKIGDQVKIWSGSGENRPLRIIYWGRIHASKGIHTVIEALQLQPELNVELTIIGQFKPDNPFSTRLAQSVKKDARIHVTGYLPGNQILPMLRTADVGVIPSRWNETGPITVFEAHAAGLPIIGSDRGGVVELCANDPSARVFPAEDAVALAAILSELAQTPDRVRAMREQVPEARTMQAVADDVYAVYKSLLGMPLEKELDKLVIGSDSSLKRN